MKEKKLATKTMFFVIQLAVSHLFAGGIAGQNRTNAIGAIVCSPFGQLKGSRTKEAFANHSKKNWYPLVN